MPDPVMSAIKLDDAVVPPSPDSMVLLSTSKRTDTITKKRTEHCTVTITVEVTYTLMSVTRAKPETQGGVGKVLSARYSVATKVTMAENCIPEGGESFSTESGTELELTEGKYDRPKPKSIKKIDKSEEDSLTYPHDTKVKVTLKGAVVKVDVSFEDDNTETVTFA